MNNPRDTREIRVFISSTFKDLETERDYLIKKTFPRLRFLASKRDVTITELDLRWGITAEESENHKTVEICLKEIDNSVPFFIGLIGDRYGWCPTHSDVADLEDEESPYSWIKGDIDNGLAVTEIEMLHGALRSKDDIHAFFFVRSIFNKDAEQDNPEKICDLRERIKTNSKYPVTLFNSVEELDNAVVNYFVNILNQYFPEKGLSDLEKERFAQQVFINRLTQNYVIDTKKIEEITNWVENDESQFLSIVGDDGIGKSALLAHWVKSHYCQNSDYSIVFHSIGNGDGDNSINVVCQHIFAEIADIYGFDYNLPRTFDTVSVINELYAKIAGNNKKTLVILDGVNYLSSDNNDKQLRWIGFPPKNIRFIFSSVPSDETVDVFESNDFQILKFEPFNDSIRAEIINGYLKLFGKKISMSQIDIIIAHPLMKNTRLLCSLLSEIISFSRWQELEDRISYYLTSKSKREFYDKVLERFEQDFSYELTSNVLSLIVLVRNGIAEKSILEVLNISQLKFSQFHYAFLSNFFVISGRFHLANESLISAVKFRYIVDNYDYSISIRKKLISYLERLNNSGNQRELPYQYYMIDDSVGLYNYLLNFDVFTWFYHNNLHDLFTWWQYLLQDRGHEYSLSDYFELKIRPQNIQALLDLNKFCENSIIEPKNCLEAATIALSLYCDNDINDEPLLGVKRSSVVLALTNAYRLNNRFKDAFSVIRDIQLMKRNPIGQPA